MQDTDMTGRNQDDQYYIQEIEPDPDEEWTTDPETAVQEGLPYMPPTDPPVLPSRDQGAEIATGFGISPEEAPYRTYAPTESTWIAQEVGRVLREDSATSKLTLRVEVRENTVYLYGDVSDETDAELAMNVASQVPGVDWVEDRTQVNPDAVDHSVVLPEIVEREEF